MSSGDVFSCCWKRAKLVLLHKGPGKSIDSPSSYRPICLLDTPEKLLERLIVQRLESHFDAQATRRAPNQFGFRKGIFTETAIASVLEIASAAATQGRTKDLCVLVTLDVKNVFNTLRWPVIDAALREKSMPEYLYPQVAESRLLIKLQHTTNIPWQASLPLTDPHNNSFTSMEGLYPLKLPFGPQHKALTTLINNWNSLPLPFLFLPGPENMNYEAAHRVPFFTAFQHSPHRYSWLKFPFRFHLQFSALPPPPIAIKEGVLGVVHWRHAVKTHREATLLEPPQVFTKAPMTR